MSQEASSTDGRPQISIVVPMYNEEENAAACCEDIREAMEEAGLEYELIFVDDGSTDDTLEALREAISAEPRARIIELRRNFGQSSAMAAGFDHARADVVIPMDGDMQNDPRDIPALLQKLEEGAGCDVVSGWRRDRKDSVLRTFPSRVANRLISYITGVRLHDYGCTLKAYRREVLQDVHLYGEMHRFIPALVKWVGGRVGEITVNHRPRRAGSSKYGLGRTFRVLLDLVTVRFMMQYMTKPLYFFGKIGFYTLFMAFATLAVALVQKGYGMDMTGNPLLYLSVAFLVISVQFVLMGLMMEMLARTYYESQDRTPYTIRTIHNSSPPSEEG